VNKHKNINRGSMRYFLKSLSEPSDTLIVSNKTQRANLKSYDKKLKGFQYGAALDAALKTENLLVVAAMLRELQKRDGLKIALSGRDEATLHPILVFIGKHVKNQLHTQFLLEVLDLILDIYGPVIEKEGGIAMQLRKIRNQITNELVFQENFLPLLGSLEFLINASIATMPIEMVGESPGTPM